MKHFILVLCFFLPMLLAAQACDYQKLFQEGKTFAKQRQYKKALYKFNSARRCDPAQGEKVDSAIEALLDQVEGEKRMANEALKKLKQASRKVSELLLREAENEIYHLHYHEAEEKMYAALTFRDQKTNSEVAHALMEVAFFYTESGEFSLAQFVIATVSIIFAQNVEVILIDISDLPTTRRAFRKALKNLDPTRYAELEARYYPVMINIKGGEFILGCEKSKNCDKLPRVKLSDFHLARTETTFWQFFLYTTATGRNIQDFSPSWGLDGDNPVVNVSWMQALGYANWLSTQHDLQSTYRIDTLQKNSFTLTNNIDSFKVPITLIPNATGYRMPTEAEWEYAARGGVSQDSFIYSGSNNLEDVAWCAKNSDTLGILRTHPVSTRMSNSLGLYDMTGNVMEWCWDWYNGHNEYQQDILENPTGPALGGIMRVLRGGYWEYGDKLSHLTRRYGSSSVSKEMHYGFRLAQY